MYKNFICIAYSSLDILFPNELVEASLYAGCTGADTAEHGIVYKKGTAVPLYIDQIMKTLFSCSCVGNAYTALIFSKNLFSEKAAKKYGRFTKKTQDAYFALLTAGETRVLPLSLKQFSFIKGMTGNSLLQKGFIAVRFSPEGRIQFLTDFNRLLTALLEKKK